MRIYDTWSKPLRPLGDQVLGQTSGIVPNKPNIKVTQDISKVPSDLLTSGQWRPRVTWPAGLGRESPSGAVSPVAVLFDLVHTWLGPGGQAVGPTRPWPPVPAQDLGHDTWQDAASSC